MMHGRRALSFGLSGLTVTAGIEAMRASEARADVPVKAVRLQTGLSRPVFAVSPPNDPTRLFIGEQHTGAIKILNLANNTIAATPYLTVSGLTTGNEQGLLGMAFDPNFATNGYFYVNFTNSSGNTIVRRYTAPSPASPTAPTNTAQTVLTITQPEANHNVGWLGFGPKDGYLYISAGDGGGANDQHGTIGNAQNKNVLLGKILRIDVNSDEFTDVNKNYAIPHGGPGPNSPPKNPFAAPYNDLATNPTGADEIWQYGLRNPFRASFDRKTGNMFIGDVGQGAREEVDYAPNGVGGINFGWRPREGFIATANINDSVVPGEVFTDPILDYNRSNGFSVTGGVVYRGDENPALQGVYFYADAGNGRIWRVRYSGSGTTSATLIHNPASNTVRIDTPGTTNLHAISSFGEDALGNVFLTMLTAGNINTPGANDGELYRLVPAIPGDANLDRIVDRADLRTFLQNYDRTATGKLWSQGDFNDDGKVDFNDYQILERAFGSAIPLPADAPPELAAEIAQAPEPTGLAFLLTGAAFLTRRRRHGLTPTPANALTSSPGTPGEAG